MGAAQVHGNRVDPGVRQTAGNGLGHQLGTVPHGVIDHQGLVFGLLLGPTQVRIQNLADVLAPQHPVVGADHVELEPHRGHFLQKLEGLGRIEQENVGIVFFGVRHDAVADFIIELFGAGVVLSKGVAGEKDLVFLEVGKHAVRPMQHARLQESQGTPSQTEFLAVFHRLVVPGGEKMLFEVLGAHLGAEERLVFTNAVHDPRQPARVVHLGVIADHQVDLSGIHDLGDIVQHLVGELLLDRIDQRNFFVHHQKRVVGRSPVGAVSVEIPDVPVLYTDIVNSFCNFDWPHDAPSDADS